MFTPPPPPNPLFSLYMYKRNISVVLLHPHVSERLSLRHQSGIVYLSLSDLQIKYAGPSVHLGRRHELRRGSEKSTQQQNVGAAKIA
jgi:hypothetical protein